MRIAKLVTRTVARVARDVVEVVSDAPRVRRELRERRAAQSATKTATRAPLLVEDIAGEVPDVAEVESAARDFDLAKADTNAAARLKRRAEKVLKRTPDGVYGSAIIERFESAREVADLDAIRVIFEANGLGDVPMKRCAPSLSITWVTESAADTEALAELIPAA